MTTRFEYATEGGLARSIPKINASEKGRGAVGMLEWARRAMEDLEADMVRIALMVQESGESEIVLMELEMRKGDDGFVRFNGKFPITII